MHGSWLNLIEGFFAFQHAPSCAYASDINARTQAMHHDWHPTSIAIPSSTSFLHSIADGSSLDIDSSMVTLTHLHPRISSQYNLADRTGCGRNRISFRQ